LLNVRHELFRRHDSVRMDFLHMNNRVPLYILDPLRRNDRPTAGTCANCSHTGGFHGRLFIPWCCISPYAQKRVHHCKEILRPFNHRCRLLRPKHCTFFSSKREVSRDIFSEERYACETPSLLDANSKSPIFSSKSYLALSDLISKIRASDRIIGILFIKHEIIQHSSCAS
jgi:hypothetical protein